MLIDVARVTHLVRDVAQSVVLPRFSNLEQHEINGKSNPRDSEDIVTVVDREVEVALTSALQKIHPAPVLGEEAAHKDSGLLDLVSSDDPLWIVDPIDGTKNFAAGNPDFGIMVAFVVAGMTQCAWLVLPVRGEAYVAENGSGTRCNGVRVTVPPPTHDGPPRGSLLTRYMPDAVRQAVMSGLDGAVQKVEPSGCAAIEYTNLLRGRREFVAYYRLLPWDHAAPALILTEAGGCVRHVSGHAYTVRSRNQLTLVARDVKTFDELHVRVGGPPLDGP